MYVFVYIHTLHYIHYTTYMYTYIYNTYICILMYLCIHLYIFTYSVLMCIYKYMSDGQNYLLLVMDMAKVGGPLSVVKVCTSMVCITIGYR